VLKQIEDRKVVRKMRKLERNIGDCPDCGKKEVELMRSGVYEGLCDTCKRRKQNAKARGKEYIPYNDLSDEDKRRVDVFQEAQARKNGIEAWSAYPDWSITKDKAVENRIFIGNRYARLLHY
jgi:ribosomal protein L37AE/L43A